ncbi:hypothetical protein EV356DRAFT_519317 [Viridothelium virens]|uniref:Uncharacterized protein n=1 Tax=Viridothelium virens TaxID=1048519 RepID=A0A6A6GYK9_VIRVR|nr:hypothetical protein EV356DRAFT_519317 [Viridothelium virens]
MKSIIVSTTLMLLPLLSTAKPLLKSRQIADPQPTAGDLNNAVFKWQSDTGLVSNFLNVAVDPNGPPTGQDLLNDAASAFSSENDELNWKAVIDSSDLAFEDPRIAQANDTLVTQGTFQMVVQGLQDISINGDSVRQADVDNINNVRCSQVLPAIDMYFAAVADFLNAVSTEGPFQTQTAVRPFACQS